MPHEKLNVAGDDETYYVRAFFRRILNKYLSVENTSSKYVFITVNHIVPTLPFFLAAISKVGILGAIIPKSSVNDLKVKAIVESQYPHAFAYRTELANYKSDFDKNNIKKLLAERPEFAKDLIENLLNKHKNAKIIIIDIGGYFASCFKDLTQFNEDITFIEDTENGQQKYMESITKISDPIKLKPVISVARSKIKDSEDINVGLSIVRATDTLLRVDAHTILERVSPIGVIGFGKIGRSIVHTLREMGIRNITVCETDPDRAREAGNRPYGVNVVLRDNTIAIQNDFKKFLSESRLIFCATGNQCLNNDMFRYMSDNIFISSCTSADDEFNLEWLEQHSIEYLSEKTENINVFVLEDGRRINFLVRGNAVNFAYGAVNGPGIYGVQAGLLIAALRIVSKKDNQQHNSIFEVKKVTKNDERKVYYELSEADMKDISQLWLEYFNPIKMQGEAVHIRRKHLTWGFYPGSNEEFYQKESRDNAVKEVRSHTKLPLSIEKSTFIVLTGKSGSGKSLVAKETIRAKEFWHRPRYFFHADSIINLEIDYRKFADKLNLAKDQHVRDTIMKAVRDYMEDCSGCIVVYDNVKNWDEIEQYVPKIGAIVIVTSNDDLPKRQNGVTHITTNVGFLGKADAMALLFTSYNKNDKYQRDKELPQLSGPLEFIVDRNLHIFAENHSYNPIIIKLLGVYLRQVLLSEKASDVQKLLVQFPNDNKSKLQLLVNYLIGLMLKENPEKKDKLYFSLHYFSKIFPDHTHLKFVEEQFLANIIIRYGLLDLEGSFIHVNEDIQRAICVYFDNENNQNRDLECYRNILKWYDDTLVKQYTAETSANELKKLTLLTSRNLIIFLKFFTDPAKNKIAEGLKNDVINFLLKHEDYFKWSYNWEQLLEFLQNTNLMSLYKVQSDTRKNNLGFNFKIIMFHLVCSSIYIYKESCNEMDNILLRVRNDIKLVNQDKAIYYKDCDQIVLLIQIIHDYLLSARQRYNTNLEVEHRYQESLKTINPTLENFHKLDRNKLKDQLNKYEIGNIVDEKFIRNTEGKVYYNLCAALTDNAKVLSDNVSNEDLVNRIKDLRMGLEKANTAEKCFEEGCHRRYVYRVKLRKVKVYTLMAESYLYMIISTMKDKSTDKEFSQKYENCIKLAQENMSSLNSSIELSCDLKENINYLLRAAYLQFLQAIFSLINHKRQTCFNHCKLALDYINTSISIARDNLPRRIKELNNLNKRIKNLHDKSKDTLSDDEIFNIIKELKKNLQSDVEAIGSSASSPRSHGIFGGPERREHPLTPSSSPTLPLAHQGLKN